MSWFNFKNIVTGGNYNKLQDEEAAFYDLKDEFNLFQDDFFLINQKRFEALTHLKSEREDAMKNLHLAKNLISRIKEVNGKEIVQVIDSISRVGSPGPETVIGDVSIDFNSKLDNVSQTFLNSLNGSINRLGENKTYTKENLKAEFVTIAFDVAADVIDNLKQLNSEVNNKRKVIANASSSMVNSIDKMTTQAPVIYRELKRIIEISRVLNKHNQSFSKKYETIIKDINKQSKWSNFINDLFNRKIVPDDKMLMDLKYLITYSSDYSKINKNTKI